MQMQYVYILQSLKDKSIYIGCTNDLRERLKDHNWHTVKTTKDSGPYEIIWYCAFKNKERAFEFERYLKKGSGHAFGRKHLIPKK